ncbi:MAG TPA: hypothetical protein VL486_12900 [Verrucomicrobiae bacterium]|nr:hypothetical protein [Verrucomicrobiae bacterium]
MVLATSVPYLINYFCRPPGSHYTWIIPPGPDDSLAYLAWSQQAARGSLLFKLKYTALPHAPFLFHPFFLVCGWVGSLLGCEVGVVHFIAKAIGVVLFFVVFFRYIDYLGLDSRQSIFATILVGVSAGFGWLALKYGLRPDSPYGYPIDVNTPESNTYWSLLWNPLFPFTLALLVLSIHLMDRGTRDAKNRDLWLSGLCVGVLTLLQPYQAPLLLALAVVLSALRQEKGGLGLLLRFAMAAFPFVLYPLLVGRLDPIVALHNSVGKMRTPDLLSCVLGFGIPLLLPLAGLVVEGWELVSRYRQLVLWVFLSFLFSCLPFWFQRKFIFGVHVPLCILSGISADWLLARIPGERMRRCVLAGSALLLLLLVTSTQLCLLWAGWKTAKENKGGFYYIDADTFNALDFLKHNSDPDDIVFATEATSSLIPAFSGNTVVWGHWAMTVDFRRRIQWVSGVLGERLGWDRDRRRREFWDAGIKFIFVSGALKRRFAMEDFSWLLRGTEKVFENASVTIYRKRDVPTRPAPDLPHRTR